MSASLRFRVLVFGTVLFLSSTVAAENTETARTDLYGDPLPRGAVARLGSARFRSPYPPRSLAFSVDGKFLVGASDQLVLWNGVTGERVRKFELGSFPPGVAGFASDGKVIALATNPHTSEKSLIQIVLSSSESGSERVPLPWSYFSFRPLALSPDGKCLLVFAGNELALWDFTARKKVKAFSIRESKSPLWSLCHSSTAALSLDSHTVAFVDSETGAIALVDLRTQKTIRHWDGANQKGLCRLTFSHDGRSLIEAGAFGIVLWDAANGKELRRFAQKGPFPFALAVSPDGKTIATVDEVGKVIILWDAATGRSKIPAGVASGSLTALSYADSKTLVSVTSGGVVRLWDAHSGKFLRQLMPDPSLGRIVAVSPQGALLAGVTESYLVGVWDTTAGKRRWQSTRPFDAVKRLIFTPDGKTLLGIVTQSGAQRLVSWDAATGMTTSPTRVNRDFLSANGTIVAAIGDSREHRPAVRLFRIGSDNKCRPRGAPIRLPSGVVHYELSPDGRTLLVFSKQTFGLAYMRLGLLETVSGGFAGWLRPTTEEDDVSVEHAAFSPDSRMVAATYSDGSIRLWDVATRVELERFAGHEEKAKLIAFSPDGQTVASEGSDHTVLVWQTHPHLDLDSLWRDLLGEDVEAAQWAIGKLTASSRQSVPYLAKRLPPLPRGDAQRLRQLMADLDSETFDLRQTAYRELEKEGEGAEDALQEALAGKPSLELRRRALELLEKLEDARQDSSPDDLRVIRVVQVLETIGTTEAKQVLKKLSEGASGALRTREARAALRRLEK